MSTERETYFEEIARRVAEETIAETVEEAVKRALVERDKQTLATLELARKRAA